MPFWFLYFNDFITGYYEYYKCSAGYVEARVIPKDARNIRIEEVADANNYLAVQNERGEYYLNGHWFIQWAGDYEMAGTIVHYKRDGNREIVEARGPLSEPLHIMVFYSMILCTIKTQFVLLVW